MDEYYKNPKVCLKCGKIIPYEEKKYKNKFCSSSCSASYNNHLRDGMSEEQRIKISFSLKEHYSHNDKVLEKDDKSEIKDKHYDSSKRCLKSRICVVCGKEYFHLRGKYTKNGSTKKCCSETCSNELLKNRKKYLSEETILKLSKAGRKSVETQSEYRRSKNEKYFCELCEKHFNSVRHNEPIFNGWDADVIIDDIKYAILWNGKWHYEQIKER